MVSKPCCLLQESRLSGCFFISGVTIARYKLEIAEWLRFVSSRYFAKQAIRFLFLCKIRAVLYYAMTRFERVGGEKPRGIVGGRLPG